MEQQAQFEKQVEELVSQYPNLDYEDIADSLEYLAQHYRREAMR